MRLSVRTPGESRPESLFEGLGLCALGLALGGGLGLDGRPTRTRRSLWHPDARSCGPSGDGEILCLIGVLASAIPGLRAGRIRPSIVLRS